MSEYEIQNVFFHSLKNLGESYGCNLMETNNVMVFGPPYLKMVTLMHQVSEYEIRNIFFNLLMNNNVSFYRNFGIYENCPENLWCNLRHTTNFKTGKMLSKRQTLINLAQIWPKCSEMYSKSFHVETGRTDKFLAVLEMRKVAKIAIFRENSKLNWR